MGVPKLLENDDQNDLPKIVDEHERRIERLEKRVTFVLGMVAVVSLFCSVAMFIAGRLWQ